MVLLLHNALPATAGKGVELEPMPLVVRIIFIGGLLAWTLNFILARAEIKAEETKNSHLNSWLGLLFMLMASFMAIVL